MTMEAFALQQQIIDSVNKQIVPNWLIREINYFPEKTQIILDTLKGFCPLHKETKFRSLIIDVNKKSYRCTVRNCSGYYGGRLVDLYAQVRNLSQLRASLEIAEKLSLKVDPQTLRELSQEYTRQGEEKLKADQLPQAMGLLEQAIEMDAENLSAYQHLAEIAFLHNEINRAIELFLFVANSFIEKGDLDQAIEIITQRILTKDPQNEEAMQRLANLFEQSGKKVEALDLYLRLAKKHEEENKLDENVELYKKIIELAPDNIETRLKVAQLYEAQNRIDLAIEHYWELSQRLLAQKNLTPAREALSRLKQLRPDHIEARKLLAEIYTESEDNILAEREFLELGRLALGEGETKEAEGYLRRLLELNPQSIAGREALLALLIKESRTAEAHQHIKDLYNLYIELDQEAQAISILEKGKELSPQDVEIRELLFNLYCESGENIKAVQEGQELVELLLQLRDIDFADRISNQLLAFAPLDIELHQHQAQAYMKFNLPDKAVEHLRKAIRFVSSQQLPEKTLALVKTALSIFPEDIDLLKLVAETLQKLNQSGEAVSSYLALGKLLLKEEEREKAEFYLKKALELSPADEAVNRQLAILYKISGQAQKAISTLRSLSQSLAEQGRWEKLIEIAAEILSIQPEEAETLISLAEANVKLTRKMEAVDYYQRAAQALLAQKNYPAARACMEKALELMPDSYQLTYNYADIVFNHEGLDSALPLYRQALKLIQQSSLEPEKVIQYYQEVLQKAHSVTDMRRDLLEEMKHFKPEDESIRKELAQLFQQINLREKAAQEWIALFDLMLKRRAEKKEIQLALEESFSLLRDFPEIICQLAQKLINAGEEEMAIDYLLAAATFLTQQGNNEEALNIIRNILRHQKQNLEALKLGVDVSGRLNLLSETKAYLKELAHYYSEQNEFKESAQALESACQLDPQDIEVLEALAEAFLRLNQPEKAEQVLFQLSLIYQTQGKLEQAIATDKRLLEFAPKNINVRRHLAELYLRVPDENRAGEEMNKIAAILEEDKSYDEAISVLERILSILPDNIEAVRKQALLMQERSGMELARPKFKQLIEIALKNLAPPAVVEEYRWAISQDPENYQLRIDFANYLEKIGALDEAKDELYQVANFLETVIGNTTEAIQVLEKARQLSPEDLGLPERLGELYFKIGDSSSAYTNLMSAAKGWAERTNLEESIRLYRRIIELLPAAEEPYLVLGETLERMKKKDEAVKVYLRLMEQRKARQQERENVPLMVKVLELEPEHKELRLEVAEAFVAQRLFADATFHFLLLGKQLEELAQWEEALGIYQRVAEIDPENTKARERLAELYLKLEQPEKAKQQLHQLGEIALAVKDIKKAEKYFLRIQEIDPKDAANAERLGKLYEAQGNIPKACREYLSSSDQFARAGKADRAIEVLNRIKTLTPENIKVREKILELWLEQGATYEAAEETLKLAELLFALKKNKPALGYCKNLFNLVPSSPQLIVKVAKLLIKQNLTKEAREEYLKACKFFMESKDFTNAIFICDEALTDFADNIDLRQEKIKASLALNKPEEAVTEYKKLAEIYTARALPEKTSQCLEKILELQPDNLSARKELINIQLASGKVAEAVSQMEKLIGLYREQQDLEQAEEYCRRALELDDSNLTIREVLADLLLEQKKTSEAIKEYFVLAQGLSQTDELPKGRKMYERILQIDEKNIEAMSRLRALLAKLQDIQSFIKISSQLLQLYEAEGAITEVIEVARDIKNAQPDNLEIHYQLAHYYEQGEQLEMAVDVYEELAEKFMRENNPEQAIIEREKIKLLQPINIKNLLALARLYQRQGEWQKGNEQQLLAAQFSLDLLGEAEKAVEILTPLIELSPEDLQARLLLANARKKLNQPEEAADEFSLLAKLEEKKGDLNNALRHLEEAINLSSQRIDEREEIIRILLTQDKTNQALEHLFLLAQIYESNNRLTEAASTYERILKIDPNNFRAHQQLFETYLFLEDKIPATEQLLWLADFHQQRGEFVKAENLLTQGVTLSPDSLTLHQRLADLLEKEEKGAQAAGHLLKLAELHLMQGEINNAIAALEKVKTYQADNKETRRTLALLYQRQGRLEEYIQEMLTIINIALEQGLADEAEKYVADLDATISAKPEVREKIARLYLQHKIPEMAIRQYLLLSKQLLAQEQLDAGREAANKIIQLNKENLPARELLLDIAVRKNDIDAAAAVVNELTNLLVNKRQLDRAIIILQNVLKSFPQAVEFREKLANLLEETNRSSEAIIEWRKLAVTFLQRDELEKALRIYKHISEILPDDTQALLDYIAVASCSGASVELINDYLNLIHKYEKRGAFIEAEHSYQRLLEIAPAEPSVLENYAEFLLMRNEYEKLTPLVEKLTELYMERGELRSAERILQKATQALPRHPELRLKLADVLLALNIKGRAVEELHRAAHLFAEIGKPESALCALRTIISVSPEDTDTRLRLVEQLVALHQIDEAILESFTLADIFIKRSFLDLAEREYRRIVNLQPNNFTAWNYLLETQMQLAPEEDLIPDYEALARIYVKESHPEEANKIYKKLIDLRPDNLEYRNNYIDTYLQFGVETELVGDYLELARLFESQNKFAEAEKNYRKILALQPDNLMAKEKLAALLATTSLRLSPETVKEETKPPEIQPEDSLQNAINNYLAILELNPQNARVRCKLAELYDQLGKPAEAYAQLFQAANIFIDKGELDKGIETCLNLLKRNPADIDVRQILKKAELQRASFKAIESAIEFIDKKTDFTPIQ